METYQTEEEQVQALKDWWKENARSVIAGLVFGVLAIGGYRYWDNYQHSQSAQASVVFAEIIAAADSNNSDKAYELGKQMLDAYGGTPYASLSALMLAKVAADKDDYDSARAQLQWVLDNSSNDGFKLLARLRMARVLATQDKTSEALSLLDARDNAGFASLYDEARGDIYVQQGKTSEAADAYRKALLAADLQPQRRQFLQMKLDDLAVQDSEAVS